jgi:hypothetical protein
LRPGAKFGDNARAREFVTDPVFRLLPV